jgi:hypothetical protein
MKKSLFIFSVIIFVLFCGCKKPAHDIKMHGYFYDKNTGTRLGDANFNFSIKFSDKFSGSSMGNDGAGGSTDANGNYEVMVHDADRNKEVSKRYEGSIHASYGSFNFSAPPDFSDKRNMELNIPVKCKGRFFLILNNANPYNAQDVIGDIYLNDPSEHFYPASAYTFTGPVSNDTVYLWIGTGQRILHSTITKNNIVTHRLDTINVYTRNNSYYQLNY